MQCLQGGSQGAACPVVESCSATHQHCLGGAFKNYTGSAACVLTWKTQFQTATGSASGYSGSNVKKACDFLICKTEEQHGCTGLATTICSHATITTGIPGGDRKNGAASSTFVAATTTLVAVAATMLFAA